MTNQGVKSRTWSCKALTDIWTGDAQGRPERLITTGLLGSIRWWFEVVVRGLGGSACDPTLHGNRCPQPQKDPDDAGHHCVVCELFGCTGWARKFRFDVLDGNDQPKQTQIKKDESFKLRFTALRPICEEEWALLDLTLRLIAEYGAIGGKTVLKPSDEPKRANARHHGDYGLVSIDSGPSVTKSKTELRDYVANQRWRKPSPNDFAWASLRHFWCVKGRYLARQGLDASTFNKLLGRNESKKCKDCGQPHDPPQKCGKTKKHPRRWSDDSPARDPEKWLAGDRGESKKVFSFNEPARTFGFIKPDTITFDNVRERLKDAWRDLRDEHLLTGDTILGRLLEGATK